MIEAGSTQTILSSKRALWFVAGLTILVFAIAKAAQPLMEDARTRDRMISEFDAIISKLGSSGASERAARAILKEIGRPA